MAQSHTSRAQGRNVTMSKMTIQEQDRRERQRAWRKEQLLESRNEYGISDPTPKQAVRNIVNSQMGAVRAVLESEY